ncbi:MAG: LysR family transcriptional regulator [Desulfobacterales bacterium]|nr:LysR family transcriptional regulator [Desulfobacterales bacterium]
MKINLENFDLNLLVAFDALMLERNVSKAADRVYLTQSAMSHALKRLRILLDDPVLVRSEKGMMPTPRAKAMEIPVREVLTETQNILYAPEPFNFSTSQRIFNIYPPEFFEVVCLPLLVRRLQYQAPKIQLAINVMTEKNPVKLLASGKIDVAIGIKGITQTDKRVRVLDWIENPLVCLVSSDNSIVGDRISLEQFQKVRHIYHSMAGTPFTQTFLDIWLKKNGIKRKIAASIAGFFGAVFSIIGTDFVMTVPLQMARVLVKQLPVRIVTAPDNFPRYSLTLVWHPLYDKDPANIWIRDQLLRLVKENPD